VKFIDKFENVSNMIPLFFSECDKLKLHNNDRCILAKKNDVIKRIIVVLDDNIPAKSNNISPIKEIMATLLSSLNLSQSEYLKKFNSTIFELRKICIQILKEIKVGSIKNENTFFNYVTQELKLEVKTDVPIKLGNLKINASSISKKDAVVVSNIHNYKGLESEAVLAIAKTEEELLLWIEKNQKIRDAQRNSETTDYPRLGYVAFSRARQLLCISCLEKVSGDTKTKFAELNVEIIE
jgi:DNA helicase-2/ATP-dependent DNA helicase PcrA